MSTSQTPFGHLVSNNRKIEWRRFLLFVVLSLGFVLPASAQEAEEGIEYEATLFGVRRVVKSEKKTTPAVTTQNAPAPASIEALKSSPFYNTTWSFINPVTEKTGISKFKENGGMESYDGAAKPWHPAWQVINETTVSDSYSKYAYQDANTIIQSHHNLFRVLYRGEKPPPPSPNLVQKITGQNFQWKHDTGKSIYTFLPNGEFTENWEGNIQRGTWRPLYGDVFSIRYSDKRIYLFSVSTDGSVLVRDRGGYAWRYWKRTSSTSSNSADSVKTLNQTTAVSLSAEFDKLNKELGELFINVMKKTNQKDKENLSTLKKRIGSSDLDTLKKIEEALRYVEASEDFDAIPFVNGRKQTLFAQEFWRIKNGRDKVIDSSARSIGMRAKSAYENLLKRAIAGNDFELAGRIKRKLRYINLPANPLFGLWKRDTNTILFQRNKIMFVIEKSGKTWERRYQLSEQGENINMTFWDKNNYPHAFTLSNDGKKIENVGDKSIFIKQ
jgi:hypothetical protein